MKTTIATLILTLALVGSYYTEPAVPKSITVVLPTEQSIKEGVKFDERQKQYRRASIAAAQIYRRHGCQTTFADATGRVAVEYGLSPRVLAALVFVESSCNPNAASGRRSVGLTQVNALVWKYSATELKDPERNLEIGASILAAYIHRYGLVEGLHAYNGFGNKTNSYSMKVLRAASLID